MNPSELATFFDRPATTIDRDPRIRIAHAALLTALESGVVRAAVRDDEGVWVANAWVKSAILAGFRRTEVIGIEGFGAPALDKAGFPPRRFTLDDGVRVVPGGTSVRRGAHLGRGVILMPPAFVNVGAFVGEGTMIDSHALVGSCAQIGSGVHLSAGAQVGGVLEPVNSRPVVVEDQVFVGALCGIFEGVVVRERAVLASGVVLTASSVIVDLVHEREWSREIPPGAVVVPGTRPARGEFATARGIALSTPCIVKYRDGRTDAATALEAALRS